MVFCFMEIIGLSLIMFMHVFFQRLSRCLWLWSSLQNPEWKKTSTPRRTASLLWPKSWSTAQSASASTRSSLIGCPGCHSTRIKRRRSTRSTISVTSSKGACLSADGNAGSLGCRLSLMFVSSSSNNPIVLGPDNTNLPKIFTIIADGVVNESIKGEDGCSKRLACVIRQVQVSVTSCDMNRLLYHVQTNTRKPLTDAELKMLST